MKRSKRSPQRKDFKKEFVANRIGRSRKRSRKRKRSDSVERGNGEVKDPGEPERPGKRIEKTG